MSDFDERRLLEQEPIEGFPAVVVCRAGAAVREGVTACVSLFFRREPLYRPLASAALKQALLSLLQELRCGTGQHRAVREVEDFVRAHAADETLTNQDIAAHVGYHPYHLSRLVKQHTGLSLHEYVIDYRLHLAREYLATSAMRVTDVAQACGFASYAYFIKLFRERTDYTPTAYRAARQREAF